MGLEEAVARPGLADSRAADLLGRGARRLRARPGRPPPRARAGQPGPGARRSPAGRARARASGNRAIDAARRSGDRPTLVHTLQDQPLARADPGRRPTPARPARRAVARLCTELGDRESLSVASFHFGAIVSYLAGRPDDLAEATTDLHRAAESLGQPWHDLLRRLRGPGAGVLPRRLRAGRAARRSRPCSSGEAFGSTDRRLLRRADVHDPPGDGRLGRRASHSPVERRSPAAGLPACSRSTPSWASPGMRRALRQLLEQPRRRTRRRAVADRAGVHGRGRARARRPGGRPRSPPVPRPVRRA